MEASGSSILRDYLPLLGVLGADLRLRLPSPLNPTGVSGAVDLSDEHVVISSLVNGQTGEHGLQCTAGTIIGDPFSISRS